MHLLRTAATAIATTALTAGVIAALAGPTSAAPAWEPGYTPTCGAGQAPYVDSLQPDITSSTWARYITQGTNKSVVPRVLGTVGVSDACSGVGSVRLSYHVPPGFAYGGYDTSFSTTVGSSWHATTVAALGAVPLGSYGVLTVTETRVSDRMDWFTLDASRTSVTSHQPGHRDRVSTAAHSIYLLREGTTKLAISQPLVPAGSAVVLSGRLRHAYCDADCGYLDTAGAVVSLQWRHAGLTSWSSVATAVTDAMGRYSFIRFPYASGSYRVAYAGQFSDPWLAPLSSTDVGVTVAP